MAVDAWLDEHGARERVRTSWAARGGADVPRSCISAAGQRVSSSDVRVCGGGSGSSSERAEWRQRAEQRRQPLGARVAEAESELLRLSMTPQPVTPSPPLRSITHILVTLVLGFNFGENSVPTELGEFRSISIGFRMDS